MGYRKKNKGKNGRREKMKEYIEKEVKKGKRRTKI